MILSKKEYEDTQGQIDAAFSKSQEGFLQYMFDTCPGYKGHFNITNSIIVQDQIRKYWPGDKVISGLNIKYLENTPDMPPFVKVISSKGHTHGHIAYHVETDTIDFYITGDAVSNRLEYMYHDGEPLEPQVNRQLYTQSKEAISLYQGIIAPGHDRPFFTKNLKSLPKKIFKPDQLKVP